MVLFYSSLPPSLPPFAAPKKTQLHITYLPYWRIHPANITCIKGTEDVRLAPQLNKEVWKRGIKGVPFRLRVRISRKRNDEEGAKHRLFSYVEAVNVKNPKGMQTTVVDEQ